MADLPDVYLRFEGIKGECLDASHPGDFDKAHVQKKGDLKEGWMGISRFSFGFGWGGTPATPATPGTPGAKGATPAAPAAKPAATPAQPGAAASKGGTLTPKEFSFSKNPNSASIPMVLKCYNNETIPKVEVEVCRYGGSGADNKIPFLRLTFEQVQLVDCKVNLVDNALPSESVTFKYEKVTMETIWTDNETGDRVLSDPRRVWWDFSKQKGHSSWDTDQS